MVAEREVAYASAVALLDLYRKRALSPVEATRIILERLDALQPRINAFCIVDRDGALAAVRESEGRRQRRRRVDPHPQRLHRHLRAEAKLWPGAGLPTLADGPSGAYWADDPKRGGCGADAARSLGSRPPRLLRSAVRRQGLSRRARRR